MRACKAAQADKHTVLHPQQSVPQHTSTQHQPDGSAVLVPSKAFLSAQPFHGMTMLFAGTLEEDRVKVMVDRGSTHSVCRPGLAKSDSTTGNVFAVSVPGHVAATQAPGKSLSITIQNVVINVAACEIHLPAGIHILLGQSWQVPHQATLLMAQNQVDFIDDPGVLACWKMPADLSGDQYISKFRLSGVAAIGRGKHLYVAYVGTAADKTSQPSTAIVATAHANQASELSVPTANNANADAGPAQPGRFSEVFIEQHSVVAGI